MVQMENLKELNNMQSVRLVWVDHAEAKMLQRNTSPWQCTSFKSMAWLPIKESLHDTCSHWQTYSQDLPAQRLKENLSLTKPDLLSNAPSQNLSISISSCLRSSKLNCSNSNTSSLLSATQVDRWSTVPTTRNHTMILECWPRWNTQQTASANIACCNRDPHEYNNLEKRSFVDCSYSSRLRKLFWKPQILAARKRIDRLNCTANGTSLWSFS